MTRNSTDKNERDHDNLTFLLNATTDTLTQWYSTASSTDIDYAMELLLAFRSELEVREVELSDHVDDVSDAAKVLQRFQKKVK